MVDSRLAAFLEQGLGMHMATRNEALQPNGARVSAIKVGDEGTTVVKVFLHLSRDEQRARAGDDAERVGSAEKVGKTEQPDNAHQHEHDAGQADPGRQGAADRRHASCATKRRRCRLDRTQTDRGPARRLAANRSTLTRSGCCRWRQSPPDSRDPGRRQNPAAARSLHRPGSAPSDPPD